MSFPTAPNRAVPSPSSIESVADRRSAPRVSAEVLGLDADGHLAIGVHVRVVNISRGGALLEQGEWLRPGTRTELRLTRPADGAMPLERLAAPGIAARCWVHRLSPLRYRTALVFTGSPAMPQVPVDHPSADVETTFTDGPA